MAEQYAPNLGGIPGPDARRDAVHVAAAPVVGLFLKRPVDAGPRGWRLHPGTVTGMLSVWTHPALAFQAPAREGRS